jgi:hypothetical protein
MDPVLQGNTIRLLLMICVFLIFMTAVIASIKIRPPNENFVDRDMSNQLKARLYNSNGMYNFYSFGNLLSTLYKQRDNAEFVKYLVSFPASLADVYCTITDASDPSRCGNMFIDNLTCADTRFTALAYRENACNALSTLVGVNSDVCQVRVLSNLYQFNKRCLTFDNISLTPTKIMVEDASPDGFTLSITGANVAPFVLSRPLFMSFGTYGLYRIVHGATDTVFTNFSSHFTRDTVYRFQIVAIKTPSATANANTDNVMMHPNITSLGLERLLKPSNNNQYIIPNAHPITIYYLNYLSYINNNMGFSISKTNVFTLIFSKDFLESVKNENGAWTQVISTYATNIDNIIVPTNITIEYNHSPSNAGDLFRVTVSTTTTSSIVFKPHPDFLNALQSLRSMQTTQYNYHIMMTYSLDSMTITTFVHSSVSNANDTCHMVRSQVLENNQPVIMSYDIVTVESALKPSGVYVSQKQYEQFSNITAIPNYALAAKYLRYII